jgi:SAM-dependent methyltransferase
MTVAESVDTCARALTVSVLGPEYFERMAASLGDKARIIQHLVGSSVLDVGAGGGELAATFAGAGFSVSALDASPVSGARLRMVQDVESVQGLADQAPQLFADRTFDNIVCSAVIHEVFSYGNSDGVRGYQAVDDVFRGLSGLLNPGGRLIVRDGVMPESGLSTAIIPAEDIEALELYTNLSPYPELRLERHGNRISGTKHAVAEFLLTLTWGVDTFHREAAERYQLWTSDAYQQHVAGLGFRPLTAEASTQQGYVDGLQRIQVADENGVPWFPKTNALWTWEKI